MYFDYLRQWLTAEVIEQLEKMDTEHDKLRKDIERLEAELLSVRSAANRIFQKQRELVAPAEYKRADEKRWAEYERKTNNRTRWKKETCSKTLPKRCRRKEECSIDYYRGDCPRGLVDPAEKDANEWSCGRGRDKPCKFLGSKIVGYEDMCTTFCEIDDVPVWEYFCQRRMFLQTTEKEVAKKKADCLKNCYLCYDNPDRRRAGD